MRITFAVALAALTCNVCRTDVRRVVLHPVAVHICMHLHVQLQLYNV